MKQPSQHHAMYQTTQLRDGDRGKKRRGMLQTSTALCSFHAIWVSAVLSATCAQAASPFAYWNPQDAAQNWSGNNNWCFEAVTTCHPTQRTNAPLQQAIIQNPFFTNAITIDSAVSVGIITFPDANKTSYTFTVTPTGSLTFTRSDAPAQGIQNGGGALQKFINQGSIVVGQQSSGASNIWFENHKTMEFKENSSLSGSRISNMATGALTFRGVSNAGTSAAQIDNLGRIDFFDAANAAQAKINNQGDVYFNGTADGSAPRTTAGNSTITNSATGQVKFQGYSSMGAAQLTNAGTVGFIDNASAGSGTITNNKILIFSGNSSGANSTITNNDELQFDTEAAGGNAKITNNKHLAYFNLGNSGNSIIANKAAAVMDFQNTSSAGGAIITNEGKIVFSHNSSGAGSTLNNSGSIFFSDFSTPASAKIVNLTQNAIVDLSSAVAPNLHKSAGSIAGAGTFFLGSNQLSVGGDNTSTTFSGVIKDGGMGGGIGGSLVKEGTGKLSLTGIQAFTGATDINAGNLHVNGSLASSSAVNVNKGGTLSGNGTFGNVHNNGGTIAPGNSIGTMNINGNLNMAPNSTYHVEMNGETSDLIKVSGTANIQSSIFKIDHDTNTSSAPVLPGKTYTIITTGGGLAVTAPDVGIADFPFLYFNLSTDGFNGYLTTSRSPNAFAQLATTPNQKAVANALDTASATNPVWQQVVGATEAQARAAFISLSNASIHANAAGVLSEQSHYLRDAVTDRLRQDFAYGTSLAPAGNVLSYAPEKPRNAYAAAIPFYKAPPQARQPAPVYAVWAQGLGSRGSLKGDGNAAQTDHSLGGVISGLDVTFNGSWRVGVAGGYSQSTFNSPSIAASGSSDSYYIALYGGGRAGAWGLRGGASFAWNDITTSRQIAAVNVAGLQRGDYDAKTTQVFGEVGHEFAFAAGALEPFANIAYVHVDGRVNEFGAAAMSGSTGLETTYTTLGLRGAKQLTDTLTARGKLGWQHALGDITPVAALAFQSGGAAFALSGSPIARDALVAEAGLDLAVAPNASIGVSWTGQFADPSHNNTVKGNFRWMF